MSDRKDNRCVAKGDIKEGQHVRYVSRDNMNIVTTCEPEFAEAIALRGALDGHALFVTKLDTAYANAREVLWKSLEDIDQSMARLILARKRINESLRPEDKPPFAWVSASKSIRETGGIIATSQGQQRRAEMNEVIE